MFNPLVSVLINNFNYVDFLSEAIESALSQTYPAIEIIVVDDGSTDGSKQVIANYADRVRIVLKENGGQGSAFNAGVAASRGAILCFLDADDFFYPHKVASVVDAFGKRGDDSGPLLVYHPLQIVTRDGQATAGTMGSIRSKPLNLYEYAAKYRYMYFAASPTSGLACNRALANLLFPVPESGVLTSADAFIVYGAAVLSEVICERAILGAYRVHGKNLWHASSRRLSTEFLSILVSFLNRKLVETGKSPVVCYEESMYLWRDLVLDHRWAALFKHMARVGARQRDLHTGRTIYRTLVAALKEVAGRTGG
jgi:glycosyltransferase involved in cell wall biosynthesis